MFFSFFNFIKLLKSIGLLSFGKLYLNDCFKADIKILLSLFELIVFLYVLSQIIGVISETPISTAFSRNTSNLDGDFSKKELDESKNFGFKFVSLGDTRLRAETACIMACAIFSFIK